MAAEREQLLCEGGCAIRGLANLVDVVALGVVRAEVLKQQIAVARDHGQEVVEVVGDASGQATDRFHLLRLAQLSLEPPRLGDIVHERQHAGLAAQRHELEGSEDVAAAAIPGPNGGVQVLSDPRCELPDHARPIRRIGPEAQFECRSPQDLLAGAANHAEKRRVGVQEPLIVECGDRDADGAGLAHLGEPLFGLP